MKNGARKTMTETVTISRKEYERLYNTYEYVSVNRIIQDLKEGKTVTYPAELLEIMMEESDKWEEFILDALLKLSEERAPQVSAEKCAALYQCFGQYIAGDDMEGPCYDDLREWLDKDIENE